MLQLWYSTQSKLQYIIATLVLNITNVALKQTNVALK